MRKSGDLMGVMGLQDKGDVHLIRHAYVYTSSQNRGIGRELLRHLEQMTDKPILIGTWVDASWAIRFYEKNGYRLLSRSETERLLKKYWKIPERQVVYLRSSLANPKWKAANKASEGQPPVGRVTWMREELPSHCLLPNLRCNKRWQYQVPCL